MSSNSDRAVTPVARPNRRGFWADARFVIGVVLVAASIAGVWLVVGAARQTVAVLAAADTLVPGQPLTAADVSIVDVALGQAGDAYLAPEELGEGLVVLRAVEAGELLPAAAVGDSERSTRTAVVVRSSVNVPAGVERGAVVELWETPAAEPGRFETPRVLVADAVVARVTREEGVMTTAGASLELVVDRGDVPAVLSAVAAGSVLSTVPAAGGAAVEEATDDSGGEPAGDLAEDVADETTGSGTEDAG